MKAPKQAPKVAAGRTRKPRKARATAPLTPDQARVVARHQANREWRIRDRARELDRRRLHPRRELILDAIVGVIGTTGFIVLFLSYLGVIRW